MHCVFWQETIGVVAGDVVVDRHQGFQHSNLVGQRGNSFVQSLHAVANVEFNECVSDGLYDGPIHSFLGILYSSLQLLLADTLVEILGIVISSLIISCHYKHKNRNKW